MKRRTKRPVCVDSPEVQAAERAADAAFDVFMAYFHDAPKPGDPGRDALDVANGRLGEARRKRLAGHVGGSDADLCAASAAFVAAVKKHCGSPDMRRRRHPFIDILEALAGVRPWAKVLEVDETATLKEVRRAYCALARKHHPDVGGDAEKMAEINAAFARATGRA